MSWLRSLLFGAVALAGASLGFSMPAQADPDVGFYIGRDGARVYYGDDDDGYYYGRRYYNPYYGVRRCWNRVRHTWRHRVVERVCVNRFGRRYVADRDYYPRYGYRNYDWD